MQKETLKRLYLCESREGSLEPNQVAVTAGHTLHLCDYCYRWHALPAHIDEAHVLRLATGMVRFAEIVHQDPVRGY